MPDDLVAALAEGRDQFRAIIVERRVEEDGDGKAERLEQVEQPPGADAVAVVAPGVVQHVGLVGGRKLGAEPLAEGEVLEV